MDDNNVPEYCPFHSDSQIDAIAERAAQKAFEQMYQAVGKGVLNRLAWFVGAAVIGIIWWLGKEGINIK
jgi:hypothetical protein